MYVCVYVNTSQDPDPDPDPTFHVIPAYPKIC